MPDPTPPDSLVSHVQEELTKKIEGSIADASKGFKAALHGAVSETGYLPRNADYYENSNNVLHDLTDFARAGGGDVMSLRTGGKQGIAGRHIAIRSGERIKVGDYLRDAINIWEGALSIKLTQSEALERLKWIAQRKIGEDPAEKFKIRKMPTPVPTPVPPPPVVVPPRRTVPKKPMSIPELRPAQRQPAGPDDYLKKLLYNHPEDTYYGQMLRRLLSMRGMDMKNPFPAPQKPAPTPSAEFPKEETSKPATPDAGKPQGDKKKAP